MKVLEKAIFTGLSLASFMCVSLGQLPSIDEPGGYEAQVESLARTRKILEEAFEKEPSEYIPKVGTILNKLSLGSMYQIEEKWEVYKWAQEKMLETPGHAEYYEKLILDYKKSRGQIRPTPGWQQDYAFQSLEHLPSPETARVLARILDHDDDFTFEGGSTSMRAAITLKKLLEEPPPWNAGWTEKWLEWRQEVRDGKRTFRFKGRKGEYNFKGPVARRGPREERRPPPGGAEGGTNVGGSGESSEAADGKSPGDRTALWIALGVLLAAIVSFSVIKVRSRRTR